MAILFSKHLTGLKNIYVPVEEHLFVRVQHVKHTLNTGKCFICTDFVPCSYFELQQVNGVTALTSEL